MFGHTIKQLLMSRKHDGPLTVGDLQRAIEGLPEDTPVVFQPSGVSDCLIEVFPCMDWRNVKRGQLDIPYVDTVLITPTVDDYNDCLDS